MLEATIEVGLLKVLANADLSSETGMAPGPWWRTLCGNEPMLRETLASIPPQYGCWAIPMVVDHHWALALVTNRILLLDPLLSMPGCGASIRASAQSITFSPGGRVLTGPPSIAKELKKTDPPAEGGGHCFCGLHLRQSFAEWLGKRMKQVQQAPVKK
jgi:hypothetical protein